MSAKPTAKPKPLGGPDLSKWYSDWEACDILGLSHPRRLNELIAKGKGPERRYRSNPGRKAAPCYNPADVDRLAAERQPKPAVFAAHSGVGPRASEQPAAARIAPELLGILERLSERLALPAPAPQPKAVDRGPWLTVKDAAEHSRLSRAMVRRAARHLLAANSEDAIQDGALKIRRAAVDELDAETLRRFTAEDRKKAPAKAAKAFHA